MSETPSSYTDNPYHPQFSFDRECKACPASNGKAVSGAGPDDMSEVKLIIISDNPGAYESENGFPMVDNSTIKKRRTKIPPFRNAGRLTRNLVEQCLHLDSYTQVWITNAIKCEPFKGKTTPQSVIRDCAYNHLRREFELLDELAPNAPVLYAGFSAYKSIRYTHPQDWKKFYGNNSLNSCRRVPGLKVGPHPAVFTYNPAAAARSEMRVEDRVIETRRGMEVYSVSWWRPVLPGTPMHIFINDLKPLSKLIRHENNNTEAGGPD